MPYNFKKLLKGENYAGHLNFSAPELIAPVRQGQRQQPIELTEKVDVWALGCCLFYLMTKKDPFHGKTPQVIKENILALEVGDDSLPPIIKEVINACLVYEHASRPSATQIIQY